MNEQQRRLDDFYCLLGELGSRSSQGRSLGEALQSRDVPKEGVYFFFEPGEFRPGSGKQLRVVRIGTHGVSASARSTLRGRLRNHAGTRAGGGNHRGSIFRLHVGHALLQRDGRSSSSWARGSSVPTDVRGDLSALDAEAKLEQQVSAYIRAMPVMWVRVPGASTASNQRAYLEANAIALLSNGMAPIEPASTSWLGLHSPKEMIRRSSLWNLRGVNGSCDAGFLKQFELAIRST